MFSYRPSQVKPGLVVAAILLISSPICRHATANGAEAQVCDVSADYSLGVEDYADARNLLGVIHAREGKTVRASQTWRETHSR